MSQETLKVVVVVSAVLAAALFALAVYFDLIDVMYVVVL